MAAGVERVAIAGDAPGVPGLQVGEVRAPCLWSAAIDEKGGDEAPERVLVELAAAGSAGAGGACRAACSISSLTMATLAPLVADHRPQVLIGTQQSPCATRPRPPRVTSVTAT